MHAKLNNKKIMSRLFRENYTLIVLSFVFRWSVIATYLPKRTDNEIKNYWNTHLKKRLTKMGIDPMTHKPKTNLLGSAVGQSKVGVNLSHMAQWESARLEAETRLVRESKQSVASNNNPSHDHHHNHQLGFTSSHQLMIMNRTGATTRAKPQCLDILKAWQGVVSGMFCSQTKTNDLESPTSILNFPPENMLTNQNVDGFGNNVGGDSLMVTNQIEEEEEDGKGMFKLKLDDPVALLHEMTSSTYSTNGAWFQESTLNTTAENCMEGLSDVFACETSSERNLPIAGELSGGDYRGNNSFDQDKNYWNDDMADLVNASTAWSPVF